VVPPWYHGAHTTVLMPRRMPRRTLLACASKLAALGRLPPMCPAPRQGSSGCAPRHVSEHADIRTRAGITRRHTLRRAGKLFFVRVLLVFEDSVASGADLRSALLLPESLLLLPLQLLELMQALLLLHVLLLQALFLLLLILLQPSPHVGESEERSRRSRAEGKGEVRTEAETEGKKRRQEVQIGRTRRDAMQVARA
jgi:hypothetical protein